MNTRALEVRSRDVRLGRRRLGPLRWGGAWYTVAPLTLLRAEQFQELAGRHFGDAVRAPTELVQRMLEQPAETMRALAPMVASQAISPRHLAAATAHELEVLFAAASEVNEFLVIFTGFAKLVARGRTPGDLAVQLGQLFGLWPRSIILEPAQIVFAVADELDLLGLRPREASPASTTIEGAPTGAQTEN